MEETKSIWNKTWFVVIMATICCLLWGSAFPCIKVGYQLFNISAESISVQILFAGIRSAFSWAGISSLVLVSLGIVLVYKNKISKKDF